MSYIDLFKYKTLVTHCFPVFFPKANIVFSCDSSDNYIITKICKIFIFQNGKVILVSWINM